MSNNNCAGQRMAKKVTRFDIRQGKFTQWMGKDVQPKTFDFVQGSLEGISLRQREAPGCVMTYMDMHFAYGEEKFIISSIASSGISTELVSRLVNIQDVKSVLRIDVWPKDKYTNSSVQENGIKLPYRPLPAINKKQSGFNVIIDSSERDAFVLQMIDELNGRLGYIPAGI